MKSNILTDGTSVLRFIGTPEGWDVDHAEIEVGGTEEEPRFIFRIPYDATVEGFECNEKMLDTFDANITNECFTRHWGMNAIPYTFRELRQEPEYIVVVAEHFHYPI